MAKFRITSPEGGVYEITAPDDATEDQVMAYAQQQFAKPAEQPVEPTQQTVEPPRTKGQMLLDEFEASLPVRAVRGATDIGVGALQLGARAGNALGVVPDSWVESLEGDLKTAEQNYQDVRSRTGQEGLDGGRFVGNVAATSALLPVKAAQGARAVLQGAKVGGVSAALQPTLDNAENFWEEKVKQGAIGATVGGLVSAVPGLVSSAREALRRSSSTVPNATVATAREAGYVLPPEQANTGLIPKVLNAWGGKIKTEQAASVKNQEVTNRLVRDALGLPKGAQITPDLIKGIQRDAGKSYDAIRMAGPMVADDSYNAALNKIASQYQGASKSFPGLVRDDVTRLVENLRQPKFDADSAVDAIKVLRESADDAFRAGNSGLARANREAAQALEDVVGRNLQKTGRADLLEAFRTGRETYAKAYTVQKALNGETGNVSARKLAAELKKGKPLTGEIRKAAEFGSAFPKAAQEVQGVNPYSVLDGVVGTAGVFTNPALTAYAAGRPIARNLLLSEPAQRLFVDRAIRNSLGASSLAAPGQIGANTQTQLARELVRLYGPAAGGVVAGGLAAN